MRPRNGPPDAVRTSESTVRLAAFEALEERRVLAVDREQQAAAPLLRGQRELAGGDEALLVRERERDAALERPERRADAREADDRVQDDVRLGALEQLGQVAADLRCETPCSRPASIRSDEPDASSAELELGVRAR